MDEKQRIWNAVLGEIELNISKPQFNTWIKNTYPIHLDDKEIVVSVSSTFTKDWLLNKFNSDILKSIQKITGKALFVRYVVQGVVKKNESSHLDNSNNHNESNSIKSVIDLKNKVINNTPQNTYSYNFNQNQNIIIPNKNSNALIRSNYTFDNFIVGPSNELAYAAAKSVAQNPGTLYNPLFIYGGVGLGKTHLIQSIANNVMAQSKSVLYVTSDEFISDLMKSIGGKTMDSFKRRYRVVDLLIIDDIQFIQGKEGTQQEVFNTFNELYGHNKQIIFTSDRPPSAIQQLSDRLKSRFEGGMIVDVTTPEFETRVAILKNKCVQKNFNIDDSILHVIADKVRSNVRELEGALNKIIARVQLLNIEITPDLVDKLIEGSRVHTQRSISEQSIIDTVCEHFTIRKEDIISKNRKKSISYARQIIMFLLREELKLSFPNIGHSLGGRDHSTVMHAYNKVSKDFKKDSPTQQDINLIKNKLYNEI